MSRGIRIAYLAEFAPKKLGTGETRLMALARRCAERGHSLTFFMRDPAHPEVAAAFRDAGAEWRGMAEIYAAPWSWSRRLARDFDVIQLNNVAPRAGAALVAYAAWPARVLFVDHVSGPAEPDADRSWLHAFVDRLTMARVAGYAGVSGYVARRGEARFRLPPHRVRTLYGGIDPARFQPASERPPGGPLRLVTVAALIPEKGVDMLLRATALLDDVPHTLRIVGEGPERGRLEELARELGVDERVTFLGLRDDVDEILRDGDAFVHAATWQEALGYTVLEAMATGLPVLASRVGGIPEVIVHEESGLLVTPGRPDELADAIRRLDASPELAARLGRAARARVEDAFSLEHNLRRNLEWMEGVVADRGVRSRA